MDVDNVGPSENSADRTSQDSRRPMADSPYEAAVMHRWMELDVDIGTIRSEYCFRNGGHSPFYI